MNAAINIMLSKRDKLLQAAVSYPVVRVKVRARVRVRVRFKVRVRVRITLAVATKALNKALYSL